ncbi:hypothetical protein [Bacillus testis]|nr:hypothetical protein [Bacillus testis]
MLEKDYLTLKKRDYHYLCQKEDRLVDLQTYKQLKRQWGMTYKTKYQQ